MLGSCRKLTLFPRLFTIYGNLLGYPNSTSTEKARTTAAMAGGAWRIHNTAIIKDDPSLHTNADKFCQTLEMIPYDQQENSLRAMVVIIEDMVIAVHDVKERLLIGAMLPLSNFDKNHNDFRLAPDKSCVGKRTHERADNVDDVEQNKENPAENLDGWSSEEGQSPYEEVANNNANGPAGEGKGRSNGETSEDDLPSEEGVTKPASKKQILLWRAEGMAETLLEDLVNFKMPDGYC